MLLLQGECVMSTREIEFTISQELFCNCEDYEVGSSSECLKDQMSSLREELIEAGWTIK